eukprot:scaffold322400_cov19-Prasinocladus_malaysianus.AAC.1
MPVSYLDCKSYGKQQQLDEPCHMLDATFTTILCINYVWKRAAGFTQHIPVKEFERMTHENEVMKVCNAGNCHNINDFFQVRLRPHD